jgi:hypothetical protein
MRGQSFTSVVEKTIHRHRGEDIPALHVKINGVEIIRLHVIHCVSRRTPLQDSTELSTRMNREAYLFEIVHFHF